MNARTHPNEWNELLELTINGYDAITERAIELGKMFYGDKINTPKERKYYYNVTFLRTGKVQEFTNKTDIKKACRCKLAKINEAVATGDFVISNAIGLFKVEKMEVV